MKRKVKEMLGRLNPQQQIKAGIIIQSNEEIRFSFTNYIRKVCNRINQDT
jgi:hypothetical protein